MQKKRTNIATTLITIPCFLLIVLLLPLTAIMQANAQGVFNFNFGHTKPITGHYVNPSAGIDIVIPQSWQAHNLTYNGGQLLVFTHNITQPFFMSLHVWNNKTALDIFRQENKTMAEAAAKKNPEQLKLCKTSQSSVVLLGNKPFNEFIKQCHNTPVVAEKEYIYETPNIRYQLVFVAPTVADFDKYISTFDQIAQSLMNVQ